MTDSTTSTKKSPPKGAKSKASPDRPIPFRVVEPPPDLDPLAMTLAAHARRELGETADLSRPDVLAYAAAKLANEAWETIESYDVTPEEAAEAVRYLRASISVAKFAIDALEAHAKGAAQ